MGPSQEIASFVATTRYSDMPGDVVELAEVFILDGFAAALVSFTDECSRI